MIYAILGLVAAYFLVKSQPSPGPAGTNTVTGAAPITSGPVLVGRTGQLPVNGTIIATPLIPKSVYDQPVPPFRLPLPGIDTQNPNAGPQISSDEDNALHTIETGNFTVINPVIPSAGSGSGTNTSGGGSSSGGGSVGTDPGVGEGGGAKGGGAGIII